MTEVSLQDQKGNYFQGRDHAWAKRLREDLGLTQKQLADAMDISRDYVSMVENQSKPISKNYIFKLQHLADEMKKVIVEPSDHNPRAYPVGEASPMTRWLIASTSSGPMTDVDQALLHLEVELRLMKSKPQKERARHVAKAIAEIEAFDRLCELEYEDLRSKRAEAIKNLNFKS